jgi:isopentenyl diphosphate isomerase/L-lactate dehydrogenase-like FMN-dependent dehydrogenase
MVLSRVRRAHEQSMLTVLFDLCIRTGNEVIEAIAMGAQGGLTEYGVSLLLVSE